MADTRNPARLTESKAFQVSGQHVPRGLLIMTVDRSFGLNLRERLVDERRAQPKGGLLAGGSVGIPLGGGISVFNFDQTSQ